MTPRSANAAANARQAAPSPAPGSRAAAARQAAPGPAPGSRAANARQTAPVSRTAAARQASPGRSPVSSNAANAAAWDAFLASRAEALQNAKSRKRRRIAVLTIFITLVSAASPLYEYACERYPRAGFRTFFSASVAHVKAVPHRILRVFTSAGEDVTVYEETLPLAGAQDANPTFSVASLRSSAAILADADTGRVLLNKNADIRVYPASLTKIMTALLAIERREELPASIAMDPALFQALYDANSTMAGFLPGETVETTDLIYGALLLSGGECSASLAQAVAGEEEDFAAVMNARARDFGMFDTHFTNATGLHDPEHYTTVRDLAKLLLYALRNETFAEIFMTKDYETAPTEFHEEGMKLTNNLFARIRTESFAGGRILGGKTGWTGQAGQCLASLAEKNGKRYIFVSTGNNVEADGTAYNFEDALNAYENGIL